MEIKEIDKIMEDTCFGSLAFCCDLKKSCQDRDEVLEDLGLSKDDFNDLKQNFNKDLFSLIERRKK